MNLELEYPFSEDWDRASLLSEIVKPNLELRKFVYCNADDKKTKRIIYSKYLMSVHKGRYLEDDEHILYINGDRTDDRIDNYEVVSWSEYIKCIHKRKKDALIQSINDDSYDMVKTYPNGINARALEDYYGWGKYRSRLVLDKYLSNDDFWDVELIQSNCGPEIRKIAWPKNAKKGMYFNEFISPKNARLLKFLWDCSIDGVVSLNSSDASLLTDMHNKIKGARSATRELVNLKIIEKIEGVGFKYKLLRGIDTVNPYLYA